jgi:integrase
MNACPPPAPLWRRQGETKEARLVGDGLAELKGWRQGHRWHPNQLRHARATELRREFGIDAARVVLGHRSPQITEVYAELDVSRAAEVMKHLG